MSRTYRRKNVPFWYTKDEALQVRPSYYGLSGISYYDSEKEFYDKKRWFYSDRYDVGSPPKIYRKEFGHKFDRARSREAIHKEMKALERGDVIFDKARNIDWLWW